jgi:hypothetical protein
MNKIPSLLLTSALTIGLLPAVAHAQIIISEVDAAGSNGSTGYAADWFELRNIGSSAVDITGWKMDDNSSSFSSAVALRGVTSIAAGQSVVFVEGNATGTTDGTIDANFIMAWFGSSGAPSGFTIGNYGGSGVGLGQSSDAVNIFNSTGTAITAVTFGTSSLGQTFDNSAGLSGAITLFSAVGVNGAFTSANGLEVGSPGGVAPVPEPASLALVGLGVTALLNFRKRNRA